MRYTYFFYIFASLCCTDAYGGVREWPTRTCEPELFRESEERIIRPPVPINDLSTLLSKSLALTAISVPPGVEDVLSRLLIYHHTGVVSFRPDENIPLASVPSKKSHNGQLAASAFPMEAAQFNNLMLDQDEFLSHITAEGEKMAAEFNRQNLKVPRIKLVGLTLDWRGRERWWSRGRPFRPGVDKEHVDTMPFIFATFGWSPDRTDLGTSFPSYGDFQATDQMVSWLVGERGGAILGIPGTPHRAPKFHEPRLMIRWDFGVAD